MQENHFGCFWIAHKCLLLISIVYCVGCVGLLVRPDGALSKPPPDSHQLAFPILSDIPTTSDKDLCVRYLNFIGGGKSGDLYGTGDWGQRSFDSGGCKRYVKEPACRPPQGGIVPAKIELYYLPYTNITILGMYPNGDSLVTIGSYKKGCPLQLLWAPTNVKNYNRPVTEARIGISDGKGKNFGEISLSTPMDLRATLSALKSLCPNLQQIKINPIYVDAAYPMFQRIDEVIGWKSIPTNSFQNQAELLQAVNLQFQERQKTTTNIDDPAETMRIALESHKK